MFLDEAGVTGAPCVWTGKGPVAGGTGPVAGVGGGSWDLEGSQRERVESEDARLALTGFIDAEAEERRFVTSSAQYQHAEETIKQVSVYICMCIVCIVWMYIVAVV
jgi:hypothetical protein